MEENQENAVQRETGHKVKISGFIVFLLLVMTIGIVYVCYSEYREKHPSEVLDSTNKLLLVILDDEMDSYSDSTQVKNALANGGQIIIDDTNSSTIKDSLGSLPWDAYGAADEDGLMYTKGALLNYISSRGWTLVQAPSSSFNPIYYFVR